MTLIEQQIGELRARIDRLEAENDVQLTTPGVARMIGVCDRTVQKWRKDPDKHFPQGRVGPNGRHITGKSEVRKYMEQLGQK